MRLKIPAETRAAVAQEEKRRDLFPDSRRTQFPRDGFPPKQWTLAPNPRRKRGSLARTHGGARSFI